MKKFVILSHGRTGSTALCDGLNKNPAICCAYELFGPNNQKKPYEDIDNYQNGSGWDYVDHFFKSRQVGAIGFKMFTFHARNNHDQLTAWDYLIQHHDIDCIVLSRRDLLMSYISEERAKQSGKWHPSPQGDNKGLEKKIYIDPVEAERYLYRISAELDWARNKFHNHRMIDIYYEDMLSDFELVVKDVSEFIGVEYENSGVTFDSLLGMDMSAVVGDYDDLANYLSHTIFNRNA